MVRNFIRPTTDGRVACQNGERAFWQSRMTRNGHAPFPFEVININTLAREVRATYRSETRGKA